MVTREEVDAARALWEQLKIGHALALANWGLMEENHATIINSLVALGFGHARAQDEFMKYREGHRQEVSNYFLEMDKREKEFSELDNAFRLRRQ